MKYALALGLGIWLGFSSLSGADETTSPSMDALETSNEDPAQALEDLCKSYIKDGTITESEYGNCLSSMTDLSESMPEPLPLTEAEASATSDTQPTNTPADSEALVSDEIVENPDPQAEQLNIN